MDCTDPMAGGVSGDEAKWDEETKVDKKLRHDEYNKIRPEYGFSRIATTWVGKSPMRIVTC